MLLRTCITYVFHYFPFDRLLFIRLYVAPRRIRKRVASGDKPTLRLFTGYFERENTGVSVERKIITVPIFQFPGELLRGRRNE